MTPPVDSGGSDDRSRSIELIRDPTPLLREKLLAELGEFNRARAGPPGVEPICIAVRGAEGDMAGGLWGTMIYDWLAIELLFVPEEQRGSGLGSALVARAEEEARARGCIGAWLDTFSFQARGFYERLGYELAGTIPDHPKGGARYFLMKRWGS